MQSNPVLRSAIRRFLSWERVESVDRVGLGNNKRLGAINASIRLFLAIRQTRFVENAANMRPTGRVFAMAGKNATKHTEVPVANGNSPVQFINYDLTVEEKKSFKEWAIKNADEFHSMVDKLIDSGYHVSVKWDNFNGCTGAFIICKADKSPNFGFILTGRGTTHFGSVMGALYRHYVLFEEVWPVETVSRRANLDDM